jgi:D-alanyl-D-alanine carboxypeptidase/D-alanyl-D-alanine-endopeptidase (penicillin-binding protein 4)
MRFVLPLVLAVASASPALAVDRGNADIPKPAEARAWSDADASALARDLDRLIASAPTLRGAHVGALVETPSGRVLYAHNADDVVQPASTMKLLVGSVALDRLGPVYRFHTTLARAPLAAGDSSAATERLVLHGGGDPLLGRADLDAAAQAAARAGVHGPVDLVLDTSHVAPGERRPAGWSIDDILQEYAPVVDGLPFEENVLTTYLDPTTAGSPATVRLVPPFQPVAAPVDACPGPPAAFSFANASVTVAAGRPDTTDAHAGRCGEIVVTGEAPLGQPASLAIAVDAPEQLARTYFVDALARNGIAVVAPSPGPAPIPGVVETPLLDGGTEVWHHDGEPLADLLADMWLPSDNLIAEQLFRELDAATTGRPATSAGARALERAWLRAAGVDLAPLTIVDGSGLSQYDRATPSMLAAILAHDWSGARRDVVLDALPIAGVRGDLRAFARGTPAAGRIWAKTGSMMHVRGLAGFAASSRHGAVVFVLSIDDWPGDDPGLAAFRTAFCLRIVAA